MLKSLIRKLNVWVERRGLERSIKRKEEQLPQLPRDPDTDEAIVTPEYRQAYEAACNTIFSPEERVYREQAAKHRSHKDKRKNERTAAGVGGTFNTVIYLALVAFFAYLATYRLYVMLPAVLIAWAIFREYENYLLWRFRVERRVQRAALKGIHKVFIEKMPDDLDQSISSEIAMQINRLVVVLDKADADAILRGVGDGDRFRSPIITGFGDNFLLVDKAGDVVWSGFASSDLGVEWLANHLVSDLEDVLTLT